MTTQEPQKGTMEEEFINKVWEILKKDSNDLRKQQAILKLYRESTHHQLQKARQDWLREEIVRLEGMKKKIDKDFWMRQLNREGMTRQEGHNQALQTIIDSHQAELNQPTV